MLKNIIPSNDAHKRHAAQTEKRLEKENRNEKNETPDENF